MTDKNKNKIMNRLLGSPNVVKWCAVGSRVTCSPPTSDTDNDTIVLTKTKIRHSFIKQAKEAGFEEYIEDYPGPKNFKRVFTSLRSGEENLIITKREEFYDRFLIATHISRKMNLMEKDDRISLFQGILYNNLDRWWDK